MSKDGSFIFSHLRRSFRLIKKNSKTSAANAEIFDREDEMSVVKDHKETYRKHFSILSTDNEHREVSESYIEALHSDSLCERSFPSSSLTKIVGGNLIPDSDMLSGKESECILSDEALNEHERNECKYEETSHNIIVANSYEIEGGNLTKFPKTLFDKLSTSSSECSEVEGSLVYNSQASSIDLSTSVTIKSEDSRTTGKNSFSHSDIETPTKDGLQKSPSPDIAAMAKLHSFLDANELNERFSTDNGSSISKTVSFLNCSTGGLPNASGYIPRLSRDVYSLMSPNVLRRRVLVKSNSDSCLVKGNDVESVMRTLPKDQILKAIPFELELSLHSYLLFVRQALLGSLSNSSPIKVLASVIIWIIEIISFHHLYAVVQFVCITPFVIALMSESPLINYLSPVAEMTTFLILLSGVDLLMSVCSILCLNYIFIFTNEDFQECFKLQWLLRLIVFLAIVTHHSSMESLV